MLIPSLRNSTTAITTSLSRRVNANSQRVTIIDIAPVKLIKKGEC